MLYHKPVLPLCLIASLAGCTAVPGMYMPRGDVSEVEVPVLEDGTAAQVDIVPITAELVVEQQRRLAERRRALPRPEQLPYESYRIGPRDVLSITVWDHPELTIPAGEFRSAEAAGHLVDEDGTLFYPYVGSIDVEGMTVEQLRRLLTRRLSTYIENPQLDVRVAAYRSKRTYITGEVAAPGIQPITDVPLTVTEAVNRAGGLTDQADLRNASLTREGQVYPLDLLALFEQGDMSQDFLLREGDILTVPDVNRSQNKIFVLGEVLEPSSRLINRGRMSLTEALGDAGGVDPLTSNPGRIYVIRTGLGPEERPEIYHLNARSPAALLLADRFELQPRDVVYVDTAEVSRWNRVITQILPTAQTINQSSAADFPLFKGRGGD
ncbi:MAG: polysaccharide export protein [Candidatus Competibacteraceae bacterium]|nr:polysaccharide export protein [Candidatus Competibacteraceae bacterium]